jgi:hypothetical protein
LNRIESVQVAIQAIQEVSAPAMLQDNGYPLLLSTLAGLSTSIGGALAVSDLSFPRSGFSAPFVLLWFATLQMSNIQGQLGQPLACPDSLGSDSLEQRMKYVPRVHARQENFCLVGIVAT